MPFIENEVFLRSRGGTELMALALQQRLIAAGRNDLLDFFDIYPSRVRKFNPNRSSIFWAHDLAGASEAKVLNDPAAYNFTALVFVSHWQHQAFECQFHLEKFIKAVIPNAIEPLPSTVTEKWHDLTLGSASNPIRLIYHTTPHRGLELLVPVYQTLWQTMQELDIHLHLDVFSSFGVYGILEKDKPYLKLFEACQNHPGITYHGAVPNARVREALLKSHIFSYPSIWRETSCLSMIEAMSAACLCVHPNHSVLPETSGGYTMCYPFEPDPEKHRVLFQRALMASILGIVQAKSQGRKPLLDLPGIAAGRANYLYNWNTRISDWIGFLDSLKRSLQ